MAEVTGFVPSFVRSFRRTSASILVDGMKGTTAVLLSEGRFSAEFRRLPMLVQEALAEHGIDDAGIRESFPRQSPGLLGMVSAETRSAAIADSSTGPGTTVRMGIAVSGITYWQRGYFFLFFPSSSLSLFLCFPVPSPSVFSVFRPGSILFQQDGVSRRKWKTGRVELRGFRGLRRLRISIGISHVLPISRVFKKLQKIELECEGKFGGFLRAELSSNGYPREVRRIPPSCALIKWLSVGSPDG